MSVLRRRGMLGGNEQSTLIYHLDAPTYNNNKLLLGIAPFAEGKPVSILYEFTLPAGGAVTNATRFFGLDGALFSVGFGSMYANTTPGGSTTSGIWFYAKNHGVRICGVGGLVKDTIYRLAVTCDPVSMTVNVRFKGGAYDITGTLQHDTTLVYSNTLGFNTGTYTRAMTVRVFDVYQSVLGASEINAFLNGE